MKNNMPSLYFDFDIIVDFFNNKPIHTSEYDSYIINMLNALYKKDITTYIETKKQFNSSVTQPYTKILNLIDSIYQNLDTAAAKKILSDFDDIQNVYSLCTTNLFIIDKFAESKKLSDLDIVFMVAFPKHKLIKDKNVLYKYLSKLCTITNTENVASVHYSTHYKQCCAAICTLTPDLATISDWCEWAKSETDKKQAHNASIEAIKRIKQKILNTISKKQQHEFTSSIIDFRLTDMLSVLHNLSTNEIAEIRYWLYKRKLPTDKITAYYIKRLKSEQNTTKIITTNYNKHIK